MAAVAVFYHLTRAGLDDTVTTTVTRAMGQGWRVMLRCPDRGLLEHLDDKLWLGPEDGFLAHGIEGGPADADQPVLLGSGPIVNAARGLILLAGAKVDRSELDGLDRVWLMFDGADDAAVQHAGEGLVLFGAADPDSQQCRRADVHGVRGYARPDLIGDRHRVVRSQRGPCGGHWLHRPRRQPGRAVRCRSGPETAPHRGGKSLRVRFARQHHR